MGSTFIYQHVSNILFNEILFSTENFRVVKKRSISASLYERSQKLFSRVSFDGLYSGSECEYIVQCTPHTLFLSLFPSIYLSILVFISPSYNFNILWEREVIYADFISPVRRFTYPWTVCEKMELPKNVFPTLLILIREKFRSSRESTCSHLIAFVPILFQQLWPARGCYLEFNYTVPWFIFSL